MAPFLASFGLLSFVVLTSEIFFGKPSGEIVVTSRTSSVLVQEISFLAVGDINLGRAVGQELLSGDTLYPFVFVKDTFALYDVVFGNLESQLSDQGGETQHPRNNLVFTGPPVGAHALKRGGVTIVSTANNHALDYGLRGLEETRENLNNAGIAFSGTSWSESDLYEPASIQRNGIRISLFSCTEIMNIRIDSWQSHVAEADTGRLFPRVRSSRKESDFIILSYHGGGEYVEYPTDRTRQFARAALDAGVDLFLGHHPHVPQGLEDHEGKLIVYSLGNFVFRQPFDYWTQRSFAFSAKITKTSSGTVLNQARIRPLIAGSQPTFSVPDADAREIVARVQRLSANSSGVLAWVE
jgi:poly-gamma-glutamate synthesis protein (capsule biosynthesis protein)